MVPHVPVCDGRHAGVQPTRILAAEAGALCAACHGSYGMTHKCLHAYLLEEGGSNLDALLGENCIPQAPRVLVAGVQDQRVHAVTCRRRLGLADCSGQAGKSAEAGGGSVPVTLGAKACVGRLEASICVTEGAC